MKVSSDSYNSLIIIQHVIIILRSKEEIGNAHYYYGDK